MILEDRVALVTGAARGLGRAFARALAVEGARLSACDVRPEIDTLPDFLAQSGGHGLALRADVSDPGAVRRVVETTLEEFGAIDILVNNAGVWQGSRPDDSLEKSHDDYAKLIGTNLKGCFLFGRAVIPHMIARGRGEIVNISTDHVCTCGAPNALSHEDAPDCPWADQAPRPTGGGEAMDLYDASKWGLNGLTLAWSRALRRHGIRVNALCMGATDTEMLRGFHGFNPDPAEAARWMKPEEVARLLLELLGEGPEGRTGENIGIAMGHPIVLPPPSPSPYVMD